MSGFSVCVFSLSLLLCKLFSFVDCLERGKPKAFCFCCFAGKGAITVVRLAENRDMGEALARWMVMLHEREVGLIRLFSFLS